MNDFTKAELQNIVQCIQYTYMHESISPETHLFLMKKIQSMIDNYCEMTTPTMANYCCSKCNEEWNRCECNNSIKCDHYWVYARDRPIGMDSCVKKFLTCIKCHEVHDE